MNPITINHKHNCQTFCIKSIGRRIWFSLALATTTDDIGTALILLPLGFCHCCGRLVQEDFVCVVDDVWLSSASPRRRLDPRRVSSNVSLAR